MNVKAKAPVIWFSAAIAVGAATHLAAQSGPREHIAWLAAADAALELAGRTGRPIVAFVDSDDCGYCRKMEREAWADVRIISAVQSSFVPLRIDAEDNPQLIAHLRVRAFPTTLLFTREGRLLDRIEGYLSPGALAARLAAAAGQVHAANEAGP